MPEPVLYRSNEEMKIYEWERGIEDPCGLCIATSTDLVHWVKHGLVLDGKYKGTWSKSGAIGLKDCCSHITDD